tara:strand:- start:75 stop:716 length:642 start_codon:yes stop_codon:yes gene_type:complete
MFKSKQDFIHFVVVEEILRFGDFTLKSGRKSPYFFNTGLCNNGKLLSNLSAFYASYINDNDIEADFIFGPAYKGITLCSSISQSLYINYNKPISFAFNRKESKDHGDVGAFVGTPISGNALIVDDVISSGSSIIESYKMLKDTGANSTIALVAFDRQEIGEESTASKEIKKNYGIDVHSLISLIDIREFIGDDRRLKKYAKAMDDYISKYKGN